MARFKDPIAWLHGLGAALIGGGASAVTASVGMVIAKAAGMDVPALNLNAVGVIFVSGAIPSVFAYLKQSPLPPLEETK